MRIVITTTLNNNLFHAKLVPLIRSRPDVEIVVVTDRQGPEYDRVQWIYPSGKIARLGRLSARLLLLIREVFKGKTKLVMAYSLVPHGLFAVCVAKIRRLPVFLHFIAGPAELRFAHDIRVTDNRLIESTRLPGAWEKIAGLFARSADRIFVPGSVTKKFLEHENIKPERITILHSTVDPQRFAPPDNNSCRDIDVVVCAQLRERKRPLFTLEVLQALLSRNPNLKFCWLGDGVMHSEFEQAIDSMGLRENLLWKQTEQVADYFIRSRIFLLCSLNEGLSLASLEAMACGVVPVAARCGDMEYSIHNNVNGKLLEQTATVDEYCESVGSILGNESTWSQYSAAATQEIAKRHSFKHAEEKWRSILEKL